MSRRPVVTVSVSLLFTLIIAQYLFWQLSAMLGVFAFLGAIGVNIFAKPSVKRATTLVLLSVSCAFALFALRCVSYVLPVRGLDGTSSMVRATVIDEPTCEGCKFIYKMRADEVENSEIGDFKFRLVSYSDLGLKEFDITEGEFTFFDSVTTAYYSEDIFIGAYLNHDGELAVTEGEPTVYRYAISVRRSVRNIIGSLMNTDEGALVTSVLIGDRSGLSNGAYADIRGSGISHITVISGLHMSILVALILWLLTKLFRSFRAASLLTLPFVVCIMAIAGFTPSIVRTGITSIIYLVGNAMLKRTDGLNSLSIAVLVQCLLNPFVVCSVSFQLTVFSTLGIILFQPKLARRLLALRCCRFAPIKYVLMTASVSLSAQIMTLPTVITTFGYVNSLSVLTNVIISLPITLLVCFAAVGVVLTASVAFAGVGSFMLLLAGLCAKFILFVADVMSAPVISAIYLESTAALLTCAAVCFVLLLGFILSLRKRARFISLAVALTIALGCFSSAVLEDGNVTVRVIGGYDGGAVVISDGGYTALIGCAERSKSANSVVSDIVNMGVDRLDLLIVPPDCDYYSRGATTLLMGVETERIIYDDERLDLMTLNNAERIKYGNCTVRFTDSVTIEICDRYIGIIIDDTDIKVPLSAGLDITADIIISPREFISTTFASKCAIISTEEELSAQTSVLVPESIKGPFMLPSGNKAVVIVVKERFSVEYEIWY